MCAAKLSSVVYNPLVKNQLGAIDYEGTLAVFDTHVHHCTHRFEEHEGRVWSVDYNKYDSSLLTTGGDDAYLKFWHLTMPHSVQSYRARTKVSSARFQPGNHYYLAFGGAGD